MLPLSFSEKKLDIQNVSLIINKCMINYEQIIAVLDNNVHLVDLFISSINYWLANDFFRSDLFII